jgi:7-keto-8-aminopelargonate synthetase-like enzyme
MPDLHPIQPLVIGDNMKLCHSRQLADRRLLVPAIRLPTAAGHGAVRISFSSPSRV